MPLAKYARAGRAHARADAHIMVARTPRETALAHRRRPTCRRNEDEDAKEATYAFVTVPRDGAQVGKGMQTTIVDEV